MTEPVLIRRADWQRDRESLREIRYRVFIEEQNVPESMEWDADDAAAVHLLAEVEQTGAVGTARVTSRGQIGRVAVLPAWRCRGIGRALVERLVDSAKSAGFSSVFLHAQTAAVPFYQSMGFTLKGQPFREAGIQHYYMQQQLTGQGDGF